MKSVLKMLLAPIAASLLAGCASTNPYIGSWQGQLEEENVSVDIDILEEGVALMKVVDKAGNEISNGTEPYKWSIDERGKLVLHGEGSDAIGSINKGKLLISDQLDTVEFERKN